MDAEAQADLALSRIAAAMGEPARLRILHCLLDGHARTSTELAAVAEVSPSTASVHLNRLRSESLIKVSAQGKHRYYRLQGGEVARALEALSVLAGGARRRFVPSTPVYLRFARTCYDHMAGTLGVSLHDQLLSLRWIAEIHNRRGHLYQVTSYGLEGLMGLGIDVAAARNLHRRFAFGCMDWSERRAHLGGAIGAALLKVALKRKWVVQEVGNRALSLTSLGHREIHNRFGLQL